MDQLNERGCRKTILSGLLNANREDRHNPEADEGAIRGEGLHSALGTGIFHLSRVFRWVSAWRCVFNNVLLISAEK